MLSLCTFRHEIKSLPSTQIFQSSWTVSYKSFSALINATFLWECEHEMKMRQFHNFNFSTVKMSVPWLMKYCPYQINDLDWIFHTSSCIWGLGKPFPQLSLNTTTPHRHFSSNLPTILFPSSFFLFLHFMSRRMPLLCLRLSHWLSGSCRYVTSCDRSVTTPILAPPLSLPCLSLSLSLLSPMLWSVQISGL